MFEQSFIYLIDALNTENAAILKKAMKVVPGVKDILISPVKGLVEIKSKTDPTDSLKLACQVAKVKLRTKVDKSRIQ